MLRALFGARKALPLQVPVIELSKDPSLAPLYEKSVRVFRSGRKLPLFRAFKEESVAQSYDREYAGEVPAYSYLSPTLLKEGFSLITGISLPDARSLKVLDVGSGSGEFLRFCRDELRIPPSHLSAVDISAQSVHIAQRDGFLAYEGRLESVPASEPYDLIYLSFFVDYDTDQAATFDAAVRLLRPGGLIVLEGWLPAGNMHGGKSLTRVTKGRNWEEDAAFIFEHVQKAGEKTGRAAVLERVLRGYRYVRSGRYGLQKLRTTFLSMRV